MNETTKLDLNFLTEEGKKKKITLNSPKAELTEEEVTQAMNSIVDSKLCESGGAINYFEVQGARYVTTAVEDIFEVE